ncbi:MAG: hypothetical protein JW715_15460 [Sedimentisphaerales bacterium]|nr:hypothetical protein [Sedimentisphaerales bacterium]
MESGNNIEILVKSSSGDPYTVSFYIDKNDISAFCSCPAGVYRVLCKHIICLINNDDSILYDRNQKELIRQVCAHLQKTNIPSLLTKWKESEELLKRVQRNAKKSKKNLEKAILQK